MENLISTQVKEKETSVAATEDKMFAKMFDDEKFKRTSEDMRVFLKGWRWASVKELNYYFGHNEDEWTTWTTGDFKICLPLDNEILDLLTSTGAVVKIQTNPVMALLLGDGLCFRQPEDSWMLKKGRKVSLKGKVLAINFNLGGEFPYGDV